MSGARGSALPHNKLPSSNTRILSKYTSLIEKYLKAFPHADCVAATVMNKAEAYQPT